jgi:hypothetical protein
MRKTASRIGTFLLIIGFVLVGEDWYRDFGWQINHITWWAGLGVFLLGVVLKLPTWVNE